MNADETLTEDLLREMVEGQGKGLKAMNRLTAAMSSTPPPVVNVQPPNVTVQPAQVTVKSANRWTFEVTERDYDGRIKKFTAVPTL